MSRRVARFSTKRGKWKSRFGDEVTYHDSEEEARAWHKLRVQQRAAWRKGKEFVER